MQEVDAVGYDCVSAISLDIPDPDNRDGGIVVFNGRIYTLTEFISVKITGAVNGRFKCPYSGDSFPDTARSEELGLDDKNDLRTLRGGFYG